MKQPFAVLVCAVCLSACSRQGAIVVGSKNFTEQVILGEIAAQQLERKLHTRVERRLNLGGTLLAHEALVKGQIDLYPEYTGTASSAVLKQQVPADPVRAYMEVKDAYRERFHLLWLPPSVLMTRLPWLSAERTGSDWAGLSCLRPGHAHGGWVSDTSS